MMTLIEKTGLCITLCIILALLCLIVFSKNGLIDYQALRAKEAGALEKIQTIDHSNQILENEIKSLKNDLEYIKHIAKHEHDMAEEGEFIFKIKSDNKRTSP